MEMLDAVVAVAASVVASSTLHLLSLAAAVEEAAAVAAVTIRPHRQDLVVVRNAACVSVTHLLAALPLVVVVEDKVHAVHCASVSPLEDLAEVVDPVVVSTYDDSARKV